jgi:hypothetical protein
VPGIPKDLFDLGVSTETARGAARVVRDYTREYTSVGYIISVRTRLFSPSSPGESFFLRYNRIRETPLAVPRQRPDTTPGG